MAKHQSKGKWMQKAFGKHPGKLHRKLHVPAGDKIPASKLSKAAHSRDPSLRREAALAKTGKRYGHKSHRRRHHRSSKRG